MFERRWPTTTCTGRPFGHLLVNHPSGGARVLRIDPPRPAICTGLCYDQNMRSVDVMVVGRVRDLLLVEQDGGPWGQPWYALVPQESCEVKR